MRTERIGGLDGLRAVAVIAVVVYHQWPDALPAGFLGVDLFMVLSGFLITGLLIDERSRRGVVRLGAFWARRFRRLAPALLGLLAGVAIWVQIVGPSTLKPTVRGQGIASLLYVGNWKLIGDSTSYGALSKPASPLLHLWSLSIEEQFYVFWPLVVVGVLALTGGRRWTLLVLACTGALSSAALMMTWFEPGKDPLRLYFGTDTRAQAFLVGAAAVVITREHRPRLQRVGVPALVLLLGAFLLLDGPSTLYRGGFLVFAIVAAVAVMAVTEDGPLSRLLDREPLRLVGRVSYGIYLWHWPIIVLVTEDTVPARGITLVAVRFVLIAGATAASWLLIERPYKRAPRATALRLVPIGIGLAAVALLTLPIETTAAYASFDVSTAPPLTIDEPSSTATTLPSADPVITPLTAPGSRPGPASAPSYTGLPQTVFVIGDSGTYDMAPALVAGFTSAGSRVLSSAFPGIGLTRPPGMHDLWIDGVNRHHPDLIIVGLGTWDDEYIAAQGLPAYQALVDSTIDELTAQGAHVLWLSMLPSDEASPDGHVPPEGQERLFSALPTRHPGVVDYLDISPALRALDGSTPREVDGRLLRKPDGWHLCPAGAQAITHAVLSYVQIDNEVWDGGQWRGDPRYNDPPGGCPS